MLFILLIPAALTATFGRMVGNRRQGWALYAAMAVFVVRASVVGLRRRAARLARAEGRRRAASPTDPAATSRARSCATGSPTARSGPRSRRSPRTAPSTRRTTRYTGAGGPVPLVNMMTGEVSSAASARASTGCCCSSCSRSSSPGLMVGRTPEYLGKKIEAREVKLTLIGTLYLPSACSSSRRSAIATKWGAPSIYNAGPQGFSETLYAYTSQSNNNGSAFAGYTGYVQPNGPATSAPSASPSPTSWAGSRCSRLASCRCSRRSPWPARSPTKRVAPVGAGHLPHGHAHVRGAADLHDHPRRGAHVLPRPPARPDRAGPDDPALLNMRRDLLPSIIAILVFTVAVRRGLSAGHDRRGAGAVRRQGGRQPDRARRQGRRLAPDRPGLRAVNRRKARSRRQPVSSRPRYFQSRPSATGYSANVTFFNNLGPNSKDLSDLFAENLAAYLKRERPYNPGLAAPTCRSTP